MRCIRVPRGAIPEIASPTQTRRPGSGGFDAVFGHTDGRLPRLDTWLAGADRRPERFGCRAQRIQHRAIAWLGAAKFGDGVDSSVKGVRPLRRRYG